VVSEEQLAAGEGLAGLAHSQGSIFGRPEAGSNLGKSGFVEGSAGASPLCPQCHSKSVWRDGLRSPMFGESIQRWLCRDCAYRFSDPVDVERAKKAFEAVEMLESKALKSDVDISSDRQICVMETKNLVAEQQIVVFPQRSEVDLKGAIVDFAWLLKKENKAEGTIRNYDYSLQELVHVGIDLFNPEAFREKMPLQTQWSETRKYCLTKAYRCFLNHHGIKVVLPKYKVTRSLPYIPPEEHLDQIIACANQMLAVWLQTLKETAARPIEAWKIERDDLDVDAKKLHISHPAKGGNPRILRVSEKLVRMYLSLLNTLPQTQKRVFGYKSLFYIGKTFRRTRKHAIQKFGNPELRKIDFYTNRYWRATMEYRRTGDFGAVMVLLGHKSLKYVLLYAQLAETYGGNEEYVCKDAHTRQEAMQLIEAGFDYVMSDKEGVSLFRKLKY
jgi:integrase